MAEARRSTLGLAVLAAAASLGLHAALLSLVLRPAGPATEVPVRAPVILSLAGPELARVAAPAAPAASAPEAEAPLVPVPPAPTPLASLPIDGSAAAPPARLAEVPPTEVEPPPPAAESAAAGRQLAEAAAPASLEPVLGSSAPAGTPAVEPPAPADEAAPEIPQVEGSSQPSPSAMPPETPPVAGATPPRPLAEAAPPAGTIPSSAVEASPVGELPPAPPSAVTAFPVAPPTVAEVRASDAAVAALDVPRVSAERVRGFVDRYDGGPCFFASVAGTTPSGVDVETFSPTVDQVMAFHAAFMGQLGVEPEVLGQRVRKEQCFAVEFLQRTRANGADPLTLRLDRREVRGGEVLSGEIRGAGPRRVEVALVSEAGVVTEVGGTARRVDGTTAFTVSLPPGPPGGPYPEMVIATADAASPGSGLGLAAALSSARPFAPSRTMRSVAELLLVRR